jgi:HK97 gp10 family phage protein
MKIEVKLVGKLKLPLTSETESKAQFTIDKYANLIRNEIVINIVVRQKLFLYGNLANSIQIDRHRLRAKVEMQKQAYYGYFHEYGTKYLKQRPFFMPAVEKYKEDFLNAMEQIA